MVEVMIIRAEKEIGMGCCGGICSDKDGLVHMEEEFKHHDQDRHQMGELYQKTLANYGDQVDVTFIDPRNVMAIGVYFMKQVRENHISFIKAIHHLLFHMKYNAVFINGKLTESLNDYDNQLRKILHA